MLRVMKVDLGFGFGIRVRVRLRVSGEWYIELISPRSVARGVRANARAGVRELISPRSVARRFANQSNPSSSSFSALSATPSSLSSMLCSSYV